MGTKHVDVLALEKYAFRPTTTSWKVEFDRFSNKKFGFSGGNQLHPPPICDHHSETNIKSAFDTLVPGLAVGD